MIETRPQNAVAGNGETGNREACRISSTAVSARGYNLGAASRNARSHQLSFAND